MISVRDTLETVKSSDVIALQTLEVAKAEADAKLAQIETEKTILQENLELAVQDAADAQQRVEDAKAAFAAQIDAIKAQTLTKAEALKAEVAAMYDGVIDSVPWELQWVLPHLEDGRARAPKVIDEALAEADGAINWIRPKPVDAERIKAVIARDLATLAAEQATKE